LDRQVAEQMQRETVERQKEIQNRLQKLEEVIHCLLNNQTDISQPS
jgi:hypothetical protein